MSNQGGKNQKVQDVECLKSHWGCPFHAQFINPIHIVSIPSWLVICRSLLNPWFPRVFDSKHSMNQTSASVSTHTPSPFAKSSIHWNGCGMLTVANNEEIHQCLINFRGSIQLTGIVHKLGQILFMLSLLLVFNEMFRSTALFQCEGCGCHIKPNNGNSVRTVMHAVSIHWQYVQSEKAHFAVSFLWRDSPNGSPLRRLLGRFHSKKFESTGLLRLHSLTDKKDQYVS